MPLRLDEWERERLQELADYWHVNKSAALRRLLMEASVPPKSEAREARE